MKKKDIFLSTKINIIVSSMVIVFICLIAFSIVTEITYSSRVLDSVDHQLKEQQKFLSGDIFNNENGYSTDFNKDIPQNFKGKPNGKPMRVPPNLIVVLYNNDELEAMSNNLYFDKDNLPQFPKNSEGKIVTLESNGYTFRGITSTNGENKMQVLANIDAEMRSINRVRTSIVFSLAMLICVALALSIYLATKVLKPVKEAYEKQVYFVQDASHEMRTPLAVIKGKLELLANSWGDGIDENFEHISKMMSEVRGLEKLNSDLLLLSKEDLELFINITKIDLKDFVNDVSEFYEDLAEIKNRKFEVIQPKEDIQVEWDYQKIKRAIIILIENAFKYTDEEGSILLKVENLNKSIKISVKDDGIGIKDEDKKRIFDRFYRSDNVRGQNIGGNGIGLSLLESICKNFGIKIKVESKYGEGSEFILMIPKIIK